ncbi:halocyanin domain-containing protein [Haloarcula sp. CK38]|nr:halocyanin domain-containing protein [Haloarcula sp. CK38]
MTRNETDRRRFLTAAASVGFVSIAGCGDNNGGDAPGETDTPAGTNATDDPAAETDTQTGATGTDGDDTSVDNETTTESGTTPTSVDEYLADTGNYDGTVEDKTGDDDIDVMVGVQGNGPGAQAYDPAAMEVAPGTLVRWVWTGDGGRHNVVSESGEFTPVRPMQAAIPTSTRSTNPGPTSTTVRHRPRSRCAARSSSPTRKSWT